MIKILLKSILICHLPFLLLQSPCHLSNFQANYPSYYQKNIKILRISTHQQDYIQQNTNIMYFQQQFYNCMAKRNQNNSNRVARQQGPVLKLLLAGAALAGLTIDQAHAVKIQSTQKANLGITQKLELGTTSMTQSQAMAEQQIQTVNQMMSKAYEHALQKSTAESKQQQKAASEALSEAELNSRMLEYISNSTFDSMMDLHNEESKKLDKKKKSPENASEENKDHILVQTQSELQNHNQSDLKNSIIQFPCVIGKGGQCLYQDKQSLLAGKMSLAAKKKISNIHLKKAQAAKAKSSAASSLTQSSANSLLDTTALENLKKAASALSAQKKAQQLDQAEGKQPELGQALLADADLKLAMDLSPHQLKESLLKDIDSPIDKIDTSIKVKLSDAIGDGIDLGAASKKEFDSIFNPTSKETEAITKLSKAQDETKELAATAKPKNLFEADKKDELKLENVKSLQTDIDINLGTVAGAVEKEKAGVDENLLKQLSEQLTLENLEVKAQKEFQTKGADIGALMNKMEKVNEKKQPAQNMSQGKNGKKIDIKSLQKRVAQKVAKGQAAITKKRLAVKAAIKTHAKPVAAAPAQPKVQVLSKAAALQTDQDNIVFGSEATLVAPLAPTTKVEASLAQASAVKKDLTKEKQPLAQDAATPSLNDSILGLNSAKKLPADEEKTGSLVQDGKEPNLAQAKQAAPLPAPATQSTPKVASKLDLKKKGLVLVNHFYTKVPKAMKAKAKSQAQKTAPAKCPTQKCPKPEQPVLVQLANQGNDFKVPASDDGNGLPTGQTMEFTIIPKSFKDSVTQDVQVLNSERIVGFSTYSNLLEKDRLMTNMDDSDYYNVTVNLVVKRFSDYTANQHQKELAQKEQQNGEDISVKGLNKKKPEANDKNIASSSFAAAASLTSNLMAESNAELAESENYTSKIAKAQAQNMASQKQLLQKKPPAAAKVMTDDKIADADGALVRNVDFEQLTEQEALNPEQKGMAANSFSAAASVGQYTGDLPQEVEASQQLNQIGGMTADKALEVEQKLNSLEQQSVLQIHQNMQMKATSQLDDERQVPQANQEEYTEVAVSQDNQKPQNLAQSHEAETQASESEVVEHDEAVEEEEREAQNHKRFMERLQKRELAQKKAWAKEEDGPEQVDTEKEVDQNVQSLSQKEDEQALDGMPARNQSDVEPAEDARKLAEQKESQESEDDEAEAEEKPQPEVVTQKLDNVYEATKLMKKPVVHAAAPKAKAVPALTAPVHSNKAELPADQDEQDKQEEEADRKEEQEEPLKPEVIPNPRVLAKKTSHAEREEPTPTEQAEQDQMQSLPQTKLSAKQQQLGQLRSALEVKIQSEINQLNQVVEMQEGAKGANGFDYELVKVIKDEGEQKKDQPKEEKSQDAATDGEVGEDRHQIAPGNMHQLEQHKKQAEEKPEAKVEAKQQIHDVKEQDTNQEKEHLNDEVQSRVLEKLKKKAHGKTQSAVQLNAPSLVQKGKAKAAAEDDSQDEAEQKSQQQTKALINSRLHSIQVNPNRQGKTQQLLKQKFQEYYKKLQAKNAKKANAKGAMMSRPATDAVALQNKSDIQTSLKLMNKHKSLQTVKDKVQLIADEAADAKADVRKAKQLRKQAQVEATQEESQRLKLMKKAEQMAQEDLQAKMQIRESAKVAAEIKLKKAKALKQKLEAEAKEWIAKKEQFDREEEQAKKAQQDAKEAAEKLAKEKEAVQTEAAERQKLNQLEKEKAEEKIIKARNAENEAKTEAKKLVKKHSKAKNSLSQFKKNKTTAQTKKASTARQMSGKHQNKKVPLDGLNQHELDQIQKDLVEAQAQADAYSKEKDIGRNINQQTKSENMEGTSLQSEVESKLAAEEYVEKAKKEGEKKGVQEAQKLITKMKTQSPEQNQQKVELLKQKLITTSQQVQEIVNNFQGVHQELVDLKLEYQQQQKQAAAEPEDDDSSLDNSPNVPGKQNKLQISGFINLRQATRVDEQLETIRDKISDKKKVVQKMVNNFEQIEHDLMEVELPQISEEQQEDLEQQVDEIKEFRDQIYLQIQTSTEIAQKDLKENIQDPQARSKKTVKFGSKLKSSLIQYLEKENKQQQSSEVVPEDTEDVQLASQKTKLK